jgi:diaminohydroxyphosphoribosylaminopyrimidine deaminase/5-amino-6-(5-phosphoribosylamino)uracil reductase
VPVASEAEVAAMRRALALAATAGVPHGPNPRVGCVLLGPDGTIVGEGYHRGAGHPHAEVEALRSAGDAARGATAVVTLEPCAHTGRTGPCTQALLDAGVCRVVFAQADLNPVAAGGQQALRAAGVEVDGGVLAAQAQELNPEWSLATAQARPFVTWKLAATLDGRVAAEDGSSRWITSSEARADVHRWRARCDAVLVGTGTVVSDDPHLTVRQPDGTLAEHQPRRLVMGLRDLPPTARVLDDAAPTQHLRTRDPAQALAQMHAADVQHVYLEGGPTLAGAFVGAGLVDRVIAYYAGRLLGDGPSALGPAGVSTLAEAPVLSVVDVARVGPDVRVIAQRDPTGQE